MEVLSGEYGLTFLWAALEVGEFNSEIIPLGESNSDIIPLLVRCRSGK